MNLSDWHQRYSQQAGWTEGIRRNLFGRLELDPGSRILEAGCGTGAILTRSHASTPGAFYGLDIDRAALSLARQVDPRARFLCADGLHLPFADSTFDAVYCHFFLLWVKSPQQALAEMARVTRPGGAVLAFAEPDYNGRIDYPPPLDELGRRQAAALARQGADPGVGRKLAGLFYGAGLRGGEVGVLGGRWQGPPSDQDQAAEWSTLRADLGESLSEAEFEELRMIDEAAWQQGERVLFVPTFYAWGRKTG